MRLIEWAANTDADCSFLLSTLPGGYLNLIENIAALIGEGGDGVSPNRAGIARLSSRFTGYESKVEGAGQPQLLSLFETANHLSQLLEATVGRSK